MRAGRQSVHLIRRRLVQVYLIWMEFFGGTPLHAGFNSYGENIIIMTSSCSLPIR